MSSEQPSKAEILKRVEVAKEQLEKIPAAKVKGSLKGFVEFVREQGVVGLAVGFVLGTQVKTLVDQIVLSFINPLLGLMLPGKGSLAEQSFSLTWLGKTQQFLWGAFVFQLITFMIVAFIVYYVVKGFKLDRLDKKKQ
jgi:large conductance mechanosensitive channel protein